MQRSKYMIIVKTNLKKIPDKCSRCTYGVSKHNIGRGDYKCCVLVNREIVKQFVAEKHNWVYVRPDWCPLLKFEVEE